MSVPGFAEGIWNGYVKQQMPLLDAFRRRLRQGHAEPEQSKREWDQLRTERKLRYNKWRKLTDELIKDGVLGHDACYECAGELILNKDRPTLWVWDETEAEYEARMHGGDSVGQG